MFKIQRYSVQFMLNYSDITDTNYIQKLSNNNNTKQGKIKYVTRTDWKFSTYNNTRLDKLSS